MYEFCIVIRNHEIRKASFYPGLFGLGFAVKEDIQGEKEECTVSQKQFIVNLSAETSKTTAFNIYASNQSDDDKDKKSRKNTGQKKRTGPQKEARDNKCSADNLNPWKEESQKERNALRKDLIICNILGKTKWVCDFNHTRPNEHSSKDETEEVVKITVIYHRLSP